MLATLLLSSTLAAAPLRVVTTTPDLASIAQSVGGNRLEASSLIVGARDPHRIEAKPSFMSRVGQADLFIAVGLDLEIGYENLILSGSRNARVQIGRPGHLYAHEGGVRILEKPAGGVSRAQGDVHPFGNPHYWLDPYNARIIARTIADRMGDIHPQDAAAFKKGAADFVENIDRQMFGSALYEKIGPEKLWNWDNQGTLIKNLQDNGSLNQLGGWAGKLARFRGRSIITYHRSWSYFVDRFDLRVAAELEPKPGLEPTPGHLREVLDIGQRAGVKVVLQEPFYSDRSAKFVASKIGAEVVVVPQSVGQAPGTNDYFGLMSNIVNKVAAAFGS